MRCTGDDAGSMDEAWSLPTEVRMSAFVVTRRVGKLVREYGALVVAAAALPSCTRHFAPSMHHYVGHAAISTFFDTFHSSTPWNWDIFEYNDTQPIGDAAGGYGPSLSVFAAPDLGTIDVDAFAPPVGHLVAIAYVDTTTTLTIPSSYASFGLQKGFNCVFLTHTGSDPAAGWAGYVTLSQDHDCPSGPGASGRVDVAAIRTTYPEAPNPTDYPAVARIEETAASGVAVGVRCAAGWCELGVSSPSQLAANEHVGDANEAASARSRVPGWFDSQRVAVPVGTFKKHLVAKMRASVIPADSLGFWHKADYGADTAGKKVARIFVKGAVDGNYKDRGLQQGWNTLLLRYVSASDQWEARVQHNQDQGPWLLVKRTDHAGKPVPATARWAWEPWDEGVWVDCDVGCCEVLDQLAS